VIQRNRAGGSASKLGEYLSAFDTESVAFDPVLQPDPMKRLMSGKVLARSIDIRVARPTNPDLAPKYQFSRAVMEVLQGSGGKNVSIKISGDARAPRTSDRRLLADVKRGVRELWDIADVKRARAVIEDEDGMTHPIDLIADRIVETAEVQMNGRYPDPRSVLHALDEARHKQGASITQVLGEPGKSLR
jgi:hypothetical protein